MRGRILGAFLSSAVIAALAAWTASLPGLPGQVPADLSQPGPYAVGTATAQASRTMPDGQTRSLQVHLWYPSGQNGTPVATVAARQIAAAGAPFPLVIFSPGTGA